MARTTSPTTSKRPGRIGTKRQPFGLYPPEVPCLSVPHPAMWDVHENSKPEAVAVRAGLDEAIFAALCAEHQERAPWLAGWLYGDTCPSTDRGFPFTEEMRRFRAAAQIEAIAKATSLRRNLPWADNHDPRLRHVTLSMINNWRKWYRKTYPNQKWVEGWLLRGEAPPAGILVVDPDKVLRCSAAWDYVALAERAGIRWPQATYERWFDTPPSVVPKADRLEWLKWLYSSQGYTHAPAFVVQPKLLAYRRRGSVEAIREAAGLGEQTVAGWKKDPSLWRLLEEAVEAARHGNKEADSEAFRRLDPGTRERMTRYARCATLASRCEDKGVNLDAASFHMHERAANERGVKQDLLDYLDYRKPYHGIKLRKQHGLIDGKLFIAPEALCFFHREAASEWSRQKLGQLEGLPGFYAWFEDWVTPSPRRGRRRAASAQAATGGGAKIEPEAPARGGHRVNGRTGQTAATIPTSAATAKIERERPAKDKHLQWKRWKDEGLSYGQIVKKHLHVTGETVSRDAVIQALRRL